MSFFFAIAAAAGKYKSGGIIPEPEPGDVLPTPIIQPYQKIDPWNVYVLQGYFVEDYAINYYN